MDHFTFILWIKKHQLSIKEAGKVLGTSRANIFKLANGSQPLSKTLIYSMESIDLLSKKKRRYLIKKRLVQPHNEAVICNTPTQ